MGGRQLYRDSRQSCRDYKMPRRKTTRRRKAREREEEGPILDSGGGQGREAGGWEGEEGLSETHPRLSGDAEEELEKKIDALGGIYFDQLKLCEPCSNLFRTQPGLFFNSVVIR